MYLLSGLLLNSFRLATLCLCSPNQSSRLTPVFMRWLATEAAEEVVVMVEAEAAGEDVVDSPAPTLLQWVEAAAGEPPENRHNLTRPFVTMPMSTAFLTTCPGRHDYSRALTSIGKAYRRSVSSSLRLASGSNLHL